MTRYGNVGAFADDELASLRPISSGGNRVITPSKNFTQNRSGSNPRSSSATKDSRALFKAIHEIDTAVRAPSRATSRRKDRRFENDNMLGLRRILNQSGVEDVGDADDEGDFVTSRAKFGLRVNWRSMFSELFTAENAEMRESFRTCTNTGTTIQRVQRSIPIRTDQWAEAETAWYQIENRLRAVVVRSLQKEELCLFVQAIEAVLLFFLAQGEAPLSYLLPDALAANLEVPLTCSSASLVIVLKDSSFHRLLLHAACQFYGLRSKSVNDISGVRKTIVTPCAAARRKGANFVIDENLSLVGYVVAVKLNNAEAPGDCSVDMERNLRSLCISPTTRIIDTDDIVVEM